MEVMEKDKIGSSPEFGKANLFILREDSVGVDWEQILVSKTTADKWVSFQSELEFRVIMSW